MFHNWLTVNFILEHFRREEKLTVSGITTNLTKVYTYGMSLISQRQSGGLYFFGTDGNGNTRFLSDTTGSVVCTFSYDAYGNLTSGNASLTAYLYCGEQWDSDLGMYYQWGSPDSVDNAGEPH